MAGFVFIHGAWLGGWTFDPVARLLEAQGHLVDAPDLPGMGGDDETLARITLADWGRFTVARCRAMRQAQNGPVILIGHSRGGLVLSHAAEDAPDAMDGLAYVCAMMLPGGSSRGMWKKHSQANPEFARAILPTPGGKGTVLDAELAPSILAQCSPPEAAKAMVLRAVSEPDSPRNAVLCLSDERYGCVPRSYIACTQDRSIPLSDQQAMIARQPGTRVYELEADHSPFLSAPQALAELLMTIAQERAG